MHRKHIALSLVVVLLVTAVVWASTEVTITKTSSKSANAVYFEVGNFFMSAVLQETSSGYFLNYNVYDYTLPGFVERGSGYIDSSDVSWSSSGVTLDTNTEDIAIIGDGGDIYLEWSLAPDGGVEQSSKTTYQNQNLKRITFSDSESASAVVSGTFFGEDFSGTGAMQSNKGKVILQVK